MADDTRDKVIALETEMKFVREAFAQMDAKLDLLVADREQRKGVTWLARIISHIPSALVGFGVALMTMWSKLAGAGTGGH